jgi:hypothetical protein
MTAKISDRLADSYSIRTPRFARKQLMGGAMRISLVGGGSRTIRVLIVLTVMAFLVTLVAGVPADATADGDVAVVVTAVDGSSATAAAAVRDVGGSVDRDLGLIGGVSATVPAAALDSLRASASVAAATENVPLELNSAGWDDGTAVDPNPQTYEGSVNRVARSVLR